MVSNSGCEGRAVVGAALIGVGESEMKVRSAKRALTLLNCLLDFSKARLYEFENELLINFPVIGNCHSVLADS